MQLNKAKPYEKEHLGPGVYAKGQEGGEKNKVFGGPMVAAFGSNDDRKLDTTEPSIVANPGPGAYQTSNQSPSSASIEKIQTAVFKSASIRKENLSGDPTVPGPDSYNLVDHKSISRKPLQGGAPKRGPSRRSNPYTQVYCRIRNNNVTPGRNMGLEPQLDIFSQRLCVKEI